MPLFDKVTGMLLPGNLTIGALGFLYRNATSVIANYTDLVDPDDLLPTSLPGLIDIRPDIDPDAFFGLINNIVVQLFSAENARWIEDHATAAFDWAVDAALTIAERLGDGVASISVQRPLVRAVRSYANTGVMYDTPVPFDYFALIEASADTEENEVADFDNAGVMYDIDVADYFDLSASATPIANEVARVPRDDTGVMHIQHYHNDNDKDTPDDVAASYGGAKPITW